MGTGCHRAIAEGWLSNGPYFTAEQALAAGLVDAIVEPEPEPEFITGTNESAPDPGPTEDEILFGDFLERFGRITVRDRQRFAQNLQVWLARNVIEP